MTLLTEIEYLHAALDGDEYLLQARGLEPLRRPVETPVRSGWHDGATVIVGAVIVAMLAWAVVS